MAENELKDEVLEKLTKGFTDKEKAFVSSYVVYLCKTRGAIAAGSPNNHPQNGWAYYNRPHVRKAIQDYLRATALDTPEMIKIAKKIAETNLADYYVYKDRIETVRKKVSLVLLLKQLKIDLYVEEDYLMMLDADDPLEKTITRQAIKKLKRTIAKYESRLEKDPKACEMQYVDETVTEKVLDINRLVEDRVPIKKVKYTERGMEVELYSMPESLEKLLRIDGAYEKDNAQKAPPVHILNINPLNAADDSPTEDNIAS